MKIVGENSTLKFPAAYGPVLRKFQNAIILQFLADRQKRDRTYDYDILCKSLDESDENWERSIVLQIVKLEILQSVPNEPKTKLKESGINSAFHMCTIGPKFSSA